MSKNYVQGKTIIITGASSGFGKIVAQKAAALGANIVCGARREEPLIHLVENIKANKGEACYQITDVTKKEEVFSLVDYAIEKYGQVDVLINNAGTMPLAYFSDHRVALEAWENCIDTNLKGTLYGMCAVYNQMILQGKGQIINISSIYANHPVSGSAVYQSTKIGVQYFSESMRQEAQGKIKVTCIKPTGINATELFGSIINKTAAAEMLGNKALDYINMSKERPGRPDLQDIDAMSYLDCDPETLADNIIYVINQPWGINISDLTVRSSNERYTL